MIKDQIQRTIVVIDETMIVYNGKGKRSRLVWRGAGIDIFVSGRLDGMKFQQAGHIAMCIAQEMHIPMISLRYQGASKEKQSSTMSKRML